MQAARLSLAGYAAIRLRNADSNAMVVTGFSNQGADLKTSSMSSDSAEQPETTRNGISRPHSIFASWALLRPEA
jgi:hypothetical protein